MYVCMYVCMYVFEELECVASKELTQYRTLAMTTVTTRKTSLERAICAVVTISLLQSFKSENENDDEYEYSPREVWYFVFVLVFVLT